MRRKEMKKLYEEGNHICVSRWKRGEPLRLDSEGFQINTAPDFNDGVGEFKLIHKRHERILDAYLKDMDKDLYYQVEGRIYIVTGGFIEGYNEDYEYYLSFTKMLLSKKENLGYNIIEELKEKNYDFQEFSKAIDEQLKEECMFEKYGFEVPDFECEIKFKCGDWIYGTSTDDVKNLNHEFVISWNIDGSAIDVNAGNDFSCYNLRPIKKPWYEIPNNYKFVLLKEDNLKLWLPNIFYSEDFIEAGIDKMNYTEGKEWRYITKEEHINLYKED